MANNDFNDVADLRGLDELPTAGAQVERLVGDAQEILGLAYEKGIEKIGLNAVMYDEWASKILDAIEVQAHSGLEYGSPVGEEFSEGDKQEYRLFCREVLDAMPKIKADVENEKYSLPFVPDVPDLDNGCR